MASGGGGGNEGAGAVVEVTGTRSVEERIAAAQETAAKNGSLLDLTAT